MSTFAPPGLEEQLHAIGPTSRLPDPLRRALEPRTDFVPPPRPGSNDWLANHSEPGQSVAGFLHSAAPRPDRKHHKLYLQPLGEFIAGTGPSLEQLKLFASAFFTLEVKLLAVLDIAGMTVYALEHPEELVGKRVELASDNISGAEIAQTLSEVIGRPIRYIQVPMEQIRKRRGEEIAKMYQNYEDNPYTIDIAALHAQYTAVQWHTFQQWAQTLDWRTLLPPS